MRDHVDAARPSTLGHAAPERKVAIRRLRRCKPTCLPKDRDAGKSLRAQLIQRLKEHQVICGRTHHFVIVARIARILVTVIPATARRLRPVEEFLSHAIETRLRARLHALDIKEGVVKLDKIVVGNRRIAALGRVVLDQLLDVELTPANNPVLAVLKAPVGQGGSVGNAAVLLIVDVLVD